MNAIKQAVRTAMAAVLPRKYFMVHAPARNGGICLTFDDGPHPEHTPRLLDMMREQRISATFFVIGQQARQYPELIRRIAAEGHAIGQHSFTHSEPRVTSTRQLMSEVAKTGQTLSEILGYCPTLFRPPKGELTLSKIAALWHAGMTIVLWNADPKDYSRAGSAEIMRWFNERPLAAGDIVLLHDVFPHAAEMLPELAAQVRGRGMDFSSLDMGRRGVPTGSPVVV